MVVNHARVNISFGTVEAKFTRTMCLDTGIARTPDKHCLRTPARSQNQYIVEVGITFKTNGFQARSGFVSLPALQLGNRSSMGKKGLYFKDIQASQFHGT